MNDRRRWQPVLLGVTLGVLLVTAAAGQSAQDSTLAPRIQEVLDGHFPPTEPGAAVLATHNGEVVFRGSFGLASMELQVPVQPEMVFCLASITKSFTAVATMMLVEEERLFLGDRITDYLPNLVHCEEVSVENLLTHTSGIPDMGSLPGYMETQIHTEISPDDLIATIQDQPLGFTPGERFEYSNTNYAILGRIVERVSEEPWEEFLRRHVFEPAHLTSTCYGGHLRIVPHAVTGYVQRGGAWRRAEFLSYTRGFGLGGLFSCVDDLSRWSDALLAGKLVSDETREQMFTPFTLADGSSSPYGYGFKITELKGHRVVGHGGSIFGWLSEYAIAPDDGIFVAVLTNRDGPGNNPEELALGIVHLMLESN